MFEKEPLILEADIKVEEETAYLKERASSIINLPEQDDRQIDLMYFSAIYVSSGENLNHAYFMPTELVMAENTIVNKALDVEHKEKEIVGHLYDRVYIDEKGNKISLDDLKEFSKEDLDKANIHIAVAGIIYKARFPEVAKEVAEGKWKISMESYFEDFDLKVGDLIITRKEAESVGFTDISSVIGKKGKVTRGGKEVAEGTISRVLRNIKFSGCGLVENPANPPSVILEVACHDTDNKLSSNNSENVDKNENIFIELEKNNVTSSSVDNEFHEESEMSDMDSIGTCVYYKKRVVGQDGGIIHENWCSKFDTECTSFTRAVDDPDCLLRKVDTQAASYLKKTLASKRFEEKLKALNKVLNRK